MFDVRRLTSRFPSSILIVLVVVLRARFLQPQAEHWLLPPFTRLFAMETL